jgi:plasmid stabilization system protein ParE
MRYYFHPQADEELDAAVRYYEDCQPGLGLEFAEEVYTTIARISSYPDAWSQISKNARRCLLNRFPYGVIFQVKSGMLRIVAVASLHRRPGYWKDRI